MLLGKVGPQKWLLARTSREMDAMSAEYEMVGAWSRELARYGVAHQDRPEWPGIRLALDGIANELGVDEPVDLSPRRPIRIVVFNNVSQEVRARHTYAIENDCPWRLYRGAARDTLTLLIQQPSTTAINETDVGRVLSGLVWTRMAVTRGPLLSPCCASPTDPPNRTILLTNNPPPLPTLPLPITAPDDTRNAASRKGVTCGAAGGIGGFECESGSDVYFVGRDPGTPHWTRAVLIPHLTRSKQLLELLKPRVAQWDKQDIDLHQRLLTAPNPPPPP